MTISTKELPVMAPDWHGHLFYRLAKTISLCLPPVVSSAANKIILSFFRFCGNTFTQLYSFKLRFALRVCADCFSGVWHSVERVVIAVWAFILAHFSILKSAI
jgi:hypothetical protein